MTNRINQKKYYLNNIVINCWTFQNSKNWGHMATAENPSGQILKKAKIIYLNRTWESYDYEMVIFKLLNKIFKSKTEIYKAKDEIDEQARDEDKRIFKMISAMLNIGDILNSGEAKKIEFKKRILKASGLDVEELEKLPIEEQKARIEKIKKELKQL